MSHILDALKKQMGDTADLTARIKRVDGIMLYPLPTEEQQRELAKLCSRFLSFQSDGVGLALSFAATASGEGASFISYHVASMLAAVYEQKVVWLDGNFLSPQLKLLGSKLDTFSRLLQDPARVDALPDHPLPLLIGAGTELSRVRGLFAEENYSQLMRKLRERYDFVIVDLPPVLETTDGVLLAQETSGLVLVVEQRFLKWEVINEGVRSLKEMGVNVLGAIVNRRRFDLPKLLYDRL